MRNGGSEGWRVKKGGEREGRDGRRDGGTERGKEGRMEGGREPEDGQPASILYLYPLVRPTLCYASAGCDLYTTTQTVSLIISKTNRTVKRHIITCNNYVTSIQPAAVQTMPCYLYGMNSILIFVSTC